MKQVDGVKYYTTSEVGILINRSAQMIVLWDKWSDELEKNGEKRLIPQATRLNGKKTRYWSEYEIPLLGHFANHKPWGLMKEFSKRQYSEKYYRPIQEDMAEQTLEQVIEMLEEKYKDDLDNLDKIKN